MRKKNSISHLKKVGNKKHHSEEDRVSRKIQLGINHSNYLDAIKKEVARIVVGQDVIVESILRGIIADGHVLIEGVPGIAKTLLIRAISYTVGCEFSRVQFTVDLLPADITGLTTYTPQKGFETIKGPIFANFVIADEINRAPPKTQSALLEAMQEKQVTIGRETFKLPIPFFVMANNNPLESAGTYKLPEAQTDRFLFKLKMGYPSMEEEEKIIDQNITIHKFEDFGLKKILSPEKILSLQKAAKNIHSSLPVKKYIIQIVDCTRNPQKYGLKHGKYIEFGGSPRASISLQIAAKADAILRGQESITPQNVKNIAHDVLRHRILLNYEGQAENIETDKIIDEILSIVKVP
ncbi:MAG: MoxR family ATPase [archaeon]|nr:MoxR family ATPase [archaeon]MCR4323881.1 MoxR family ATPase [Nanoarchaeota archaeon]